MDQIVKIAELEEKKAKKLRVLNVKACSTSISLSRTHKTQSNVSLINMFDC